MLLIFSIKRLIQSLHLNFIQHNPKDQFYKKNNSIFNNKIYLNYFSKL